jgi:hypothetical protein
MPRLQVGLPAVVTSSPTWPPNYAVQAGNPLQQLAAAKAQAASQPNLGVGHGATLWPAATIGTSRPVGPLARFHFSQPQTSSQIYSQQQVRTGSWGCWTRTLHVRAKALSSAAAAYVPGHTTVKAALPPCVALQVFGSQNGAPPHGEPRVEAAAAPTQTLRHLKFMKGGLGSQVVSGAHPGVLPWSQVGL